MQRGREGTNIQKNDLNHRCVCDVLVDIDFDGEKIFFSDFIVYFILFCFISKNNIYYYIETLIVS